VSREPLALPPFRALALDAAALCALKVALSVWVLGRGFSHVSDDDYARTVIAEQFAHAPRLDPSATSWLPLPFWLEGTTMMLAGRSLGVARAVAVTLGVGSVCLPYWAMRWARVPRAAAAIAVIVAMALPWNAWLAVATVPEGWTGALVAAAAIAMGRPGAEPLSAAALMAASLSRYEAWPACAVLAALCIWRATHEASAGRNWGCALVAVVGPLAWMIWNAHAHGNALHFLSRVSSFRHAVGAADVPVRDKLFGYPWALVQETPEAAVLGIAGAAGVTFCGVLRARWRFAMGVAIAIGAFLVYGDLRDTAPTHHPARALAAVWWILVGAGVDATFVLVLGVATRTRRLAFSGAAALLAISWCAWLPSRWSAMPGRGESERRDAQIARGFEMRSRHVIRALITPCSFEHFALLAAWGEPERADVGRRTGKAPSDTCPSVVETGP
jgi:hypothetical protein